MSSRSVTILFNGKDNVSRVAGKVEGSLRSMAKQALAMTAGFFAISKAVSFASESLEEFLEAEDVSKKLGIAIKSLGDNAPVTAKEVKALADRIHQLTSFEDDAAVAASKNLLAVRGLTKEGFEKALRVSTDLAAFMGGELPDAAETLAKALSKPESAAKLLRSAGVLLTAEEVEQIKAFKEAGDAAGAMASLMDSVAQRVGGSAQEMRDTTKGQLDQVKKDWKDLQEFFGANVIRPVISGLADLTKGQDRAGRISELDDLIRRSQTFNGFKLPSTVNAWREERDKLRAQEAVEFQEILARDRRGRAVSNNAADMARKREQMQEAADAKLWDRPETNNRVGKIFDEMAKRFGQLGGLQNIGKEKLAEAMKFAEQFDRDHPQIAKAKRDRERMAEIGPLAATESRFLTRGGGAINPLLMEQKQANRLNAQAIKELKEQNTKLQKIAEKRGLAAANFN